MYSLNIYDEEELSKAVIFETATFDLKKILSEQTSILHSALSVITPSQTGHLSFLPVYDNDEYDYLQHAFMADLLLSRLYPDYIRTKIKDDQSIYAREGKNKIFILTIELSLIIFLPPDGKINEYQYNQLLKIINQAKESDYATTITRDDGSFIFGEFIINDNHIPINQIDSVMERLKKHITTIPIPPQYNLNGLDFSGCKSEEDFERKASEFASHYMEPANIIYPDSKKIEDEIR